MPSFLSTNISAAVGGAAAIDIQPAAGNAYLIKDFFADAVFVGGVPDLQVSIRDAVLADCIVILDPTTAVQKLRQKELYITNGNYLRMTNTAVGAQNLGWTGHQVPVGIVRTDIYTAPNGGFVDIRPPLGEVWKVTEIGCEVMNASDHPDLSLFITDGVLVASMLADGTRNLVWEKGWNLYLTHDLWLRAEPIAAADRDVAISAILVSVVPFGAIQDLGAAANLDIQPAAGEEAVVTQTSAETWAGVAPAGSPDNFCALYNGAVLSDIMEDGTVADSLIHNRKHEIEIDNDVYIRITEGSGANNEVSYSGFMRRYYNV